MDEKPPYTIVGTPFSTFTRTITLGLLYKGLKFAQIATKPQTEIAKANHPFAYLPTLIIHGSEKGKDDVKLRESQAIVRCVDRVAPDPSLQLQSGNDIDIEENMWEFVSLAASFGFPMIEATVVKPRVKALDEGELTDQEIRSHIQEGVVELERYLKVAESLMAPEGFVFGEKLTWADFFLYPLLSDLKMVPEWEVVSDRLKEWTNKMEGLSVVEATKPGTLSAGARP